MKLEPFLKWPGGKRWLFRRFGNELSFEHGKLFDPFLGGGSSFFHFQPNSAILSDINSDLINTYTIMRDYHQMLSNLLVQHQERHSTEYYYQIRNTEDHMNPIERAARFIYLNRMCYNGMYRVNKHGRFNVPIGTKNNCIYDIDLFEQYSELLKRATLEVCDFSYSINIAKNNDLIFADPPYAYKCAEEGFSYYNNSLFSWEDQIRLCKALSEARDRGATVFATNSYNEKVIEIYQNYRFYIVPILRHSSISGKTQSRRMQTELLISSNPQITNWGKRY